MTRLAVVLLVACGSKSTAPAAEVTAVDVASDNAMIPFGWRGKLQFAAGTIVNEQTFDLAVPKGWKPGLTAGTLEPADSAGFGSKVFGKSELRVGSGCDGACEPKDWAAAVDEAVYQRYTNGGVRGTVLHDTKRPDGRTLIFEVTQNVHEVHLVTTWWTEGDSKYYECRATLGEASIALYPVFEKVCAKVVPR